VAERRLRIDRLVVRMRGAGEPQARQLVAGLGEAVLRRLGASSVLGAQTPVALHIDRVDAGSLGPSSPERVAAHLADAVAARLPPPKGER
jgi:hypothetical protein